MFCHGGLLRNLTTEITERTESFLEILCDLCDLCGLFQSFVVAQRSAMGDFRDFPDFGDRLTSMLHSVGGFRPPLPSLASPPPSPLQPSPDTIATGGTPADLSMEDARRLVFGKRLD